MSPDNRYCFSLPASPKLAVLHKHLEFQRVVERGRPRKWSACAPSGKVLSGRALRSVNVWEMGIFDCRKMMRSEEHTSELQSRQYLVCRLLLEKKKNSKYSRATLLAASADTQY